MKVIARVEYKSFPNHGLPKEPMMAEVEGETVEAVLEDAYKKFQNGGPGMGEASEHFGVRSMSVGDEVTVDGRTFVCASMGFVDIKEHPEALEDFMVKLHREVH